MSKNERFRAEQVSTAVDQLLHEPTTQPESVDPADADVLGTARRLAQLSALLGPAGPALEQRVMSAIRAPVGPLPPHAPTPRARRLRLGWAAVGLTVVLLAALLWTPQGQTAVASFLAVFRLGRTEVSIAPVGTPSALPATALAASTAVRESLTLEEAQQRVPFAFPQLAYLPPGYALRAVDSYSYPDLPAWVPQPFFVELVYGNGHGDDLVLRVYSIVLGDQASISRLNLQATPIQEVRDVEVDGQPAVLLRLGHGLDQVAWQELVWEQDDRILALSSAYLSAEELLRIAASVR
jgi:hypothetical protein